MPVFTKQPVYCSMCGGKGYMEISRGPLICSVGCWDEYNWRKALYIMGKDYYPQPERPFEDRDSIAG